MNAFWIILIIIGSIILIVVLFLIFAAWGISMGLRNKYGPEWIPSELKIKFNHLNISCENKRTIKYSLNDYETKEIFNQISILIENNNIIDFNNLQIPLCKWIKLDNETYEFREIESRMLIWVFWHNI